MARGEIAAQGIREGSKVARRGKAARVAREASKVARREIAALGIKQASKVAWGMAGNRRRKGDNRNRVVERGSKVARRGKATEAMGMSSRVARLNLKSLRCRNLQPKRLCLTNPLPRGNLRLLLSLRLLGLLWGRIGLWRLTLLITSPAAP